MKSHCIYGSDSCKICEKVDKKYPEGLEKPNSYIDQTDSVKKFIHSIPAQVMGSLGGKASAKSLTKKQRHERAKKAVEAREEKRKLTTNNK